MIAMTRGRAPALMLVGSVAIALSGCASYSGYASSPGSSYAFDYTASACAPYDDNPGCDYGDPYGFFDYGDGRLRRDGLRHDDSRYGDYHANGYAMTHDIGHGGFEHGGFGHGGFGGGGHGR